MTKILAPKDVASLKSLAESPGLKCCEVDWKSLCDSHEALRMEAQYWEAKERAKWIGHFPKSLEQQLEEEKARTQRLITVLEELVSPIQHDGDCTNKGFEQDDGCEIHLQIAEERRSRAKAVLHES